jgi:DNA-directed RNA polymerase subunit RPC12/RpoP
VVRGWSGDEQVMMSEQTIDVLCHKCGQTFSAFLHQMEDQNAKVVCPDCSKNEDCEPIQNPPSGQPIRKKI